jgi:uncharacterized RDD family membrane protein YckC
VTNLPPPPPGAYLPPPSYGPLPTVRFAGVGARFGAMLLDGLIVSLMLVPAIVAIFAGPKEIKGCAVDVDGTIVLGGVNNALCEVPTGATIALAVLLGLAGWIAGLVYYVRGDARGQTVGKKATGVRVVDASTGMPIGTGRAVGRFFARLISAFPFYLGYFWALWDPRKQTWHDKMVNSVVIAV